MIKNKPTKKDIEKLYYGKKLTIKQVAERLGEKYNVRRSTIGNLMREYGIQARSVSQARLPPGVIIPKERELRDRYLGRKMNLEEISKEYGVSSSLIRNLVKKFGIKIRSNSETKLIANCKKRGGIELPSREELEEQYHNQRSTMKQIAEKYNVSLGTIRLVMMKNKLKIKSRWEVRLPKKVILPGKEELEKLYWGQTLNTGEIGEKYGVSQMAILGHMKRLGIKPRSKSEARLIAERRIRSGLSKPTKDELKELYWARELSIEEIARKYKRSEGVIRKQMDKYGVKVRSISEAKSIAYQKLRGGNKLPTRGELERLYVAEGLSMEKIGKKYNVGATTIGNLIKDYHIETRLSRGLFLEEGQGSLLEEYVNEGSPEEVDEER